MTRQSYRHELVTALTMPLAMSLMVTVYLLGKFRANMKQLRLRWQRLEGGAHCPAPSPHRHM